MSDLVRITRFASDSSHPRGTRVYVTGPHFGQDIYSSTTDPAAASSFERAEAERLVATKWHGTHPAIEEMTT